jgi:hypothetical protein
MPIVIALFLAAPLLVGGLFWILFCFLFIALSSLNIMVGCRAAFQAMGRHNELDFGRLVAKSFSFSAVQMLATVFLTLVLGGIIAVTFLGSDGGAAFLANPAGNLDYLAGFVGGHPVTLLVLILGFAASLAISAVLAVPMAGAAISATPKMGPTDAFIGIGTAFLPIFILVAATAVGCAAIGAYAAIGNLLGGLAQTITLYMSNAPLIWPATADLGLGLAMLLLVFWTSCWFYAAAALGWKSYTDNRDAAIANKVQAERFEPDELRALREQRDRARNGI